jgi:porphobilinogen deaminase
MQLFRRFRVRSLLILPLRIGTRASRLALWQAHFVADRLRPIAAPRTVELVEIETSGDLVLDKPLAQIGGEGVFTRKSSVPSATAASMWLSTV